MLVLTVFVSFSLFLYVFFYGMCDDLSVLHFGCLSLLLSFKLSVFLSEFLSHCLSPCLGLRLFLQCSGIITSNSESHLES